MFIIVSGLLYLYQKPNVNQMYSKCLEKFNENLVISCNGLAECTIKNYVWLFYKDFKLSMFGYKQEYLGC